MQTVGVRELKNRLSHHLKRVRAGARLTVTERGKPIATLAPVQEKTTRRGCARWSPRAAPT